MKHIKMRTYWMEYYTKLASFRALDVCALTMVTRWVYSVNLKFLKMIF